MSPEPYDKLQRSGIVAACLKPVKHVKNIKKLWGVTRPQYQDRDDAIESYRARTPIAPQLQREALEEAPRRSGQPGAQPQFCSVAPLSDHQGQGLSLWTSYPRPEAQQRSSPLRSSLISPDPMVQVWPVFSFEPVVRLEQTGLRALLHHAG